MREKIFLLSMRSILILILYKKKLQENIQFINFNQIRFSLICGCFAVRYFTNFKDKKE